MIENISEESIDSRFLEQEEQGHLVHDMKSPYNGIVGLSEPMAKMAKEPEKKKQLTWLNISGARWCKYIEATVESAPLASGVVEIKPESINIGFLVEEACALLTVSKDSHNTPIKKGEVSLVNHVPFEGLVATGSDMHTAKSIFHVLLNSVKFTDSGTICVSHKLHDESHIVIVVEDTGIGMSEIQVESACDPFVKFTDRLPGESLGLGLSSTKEYIDFVGGKVTIQSKVGKGTTVELWIPKVACNIGTHTKGPFGFGYFRSSSPLQGPWLLQKRALGILAADILPAHYGIAGLADLLFDTETKPQSKKQYGMIQRSANRVIEVLSLIRDATLRSEPVLKPRAATCRFGPMAEDIMTELSKALDKRGQPMKKKTVEFVVEHQNTPIVIADPFYVYRIVHQLCDNALKFTNEGTVTLTASESSNRGLKITVSDTGVGFDMAKLEDIFKPLHRLEPEKFYGLGLGLCMVKDMVSRIPASSIEFNSVIGKGTCVTVTIAEGSATSDDQSGAIPVSPALPDSPKDPSDGNGNAASSHLNQPVISNFSALNQPVISDISAQASPVPLHDPGEPVAEVKTDSKPGETTVAVGDDRMRSTKSEPTPEMQTAIPPSVPAAITSDPSHHTDSASAEPVGPLINQVGASSPTGLTIPNGNSGGDSGTTAAVPETLQFVFADQPKDDEDLDMVKRKTLAGDKYRILVEMDDGSEPPSIQGALSNLSLALEILKERIAVANAMSNNIKSILSKIESKYH